MKQKILLPLLLVFAAASAYAGANCGGGDKSGCGYDKPAKSQATSVEVAKSCDKGDECSGEKKKQTVAKPKASCCSEGGKKAS